MSDSIIELTSRIRLKMNLDILETGKFPNGKRLSAQDRADVEAETILLEQNAAPRTRTREAVQLSLDFDTLRA